MRQHGANATAMWIERTPEGRGVLNAEHRIGPVGRTRESPEEDSMLPDAGSGCLAGCITSAAL